MTKRWRPKAFRVGPPYLLMCFLFPLDGSAQIEPASSVLINSEEASPQYHTPRPLDS